MPLAAISITFSKLLVAVSTSSSRSTDISTDLAASVADFMLDSNVPMALWAAFAAVAKSLSNPENGLGLTLVSTAPFVPVDDTVDGVAPPDCIASYSSLVKSAY